MDRVRSVYLDSSTISVIVPIYNVELFLQECIDSVLAQSFHNFELILVDDESPDKCGEICDIAASKDSRIRVIHQKNGGEHAARKGGVAVAQGEWIFFLDPDDRLTPNALKDLITACDDLGYNIGDFDIIEGGIVPFIKNEKTGQDEYIKQPFNDIELEKGGSFIADGLEYSKEVGLLGMCFRTSMCIKLIRRSLLFETDALNIPREFFYGGDALTNLKLSRKVRKALWIQKTVYEYRRYPQSTLNSTNDYRLFPYTLLWWNYAKDIFKDMSEEWQEPYKNLIATRFYLHFGKIMGKTWRLRALEFAPYLAVLHEKRNLLPFAAKVCLLSTHFPFILIPEQFFYAMFFLPKFVALLPKRIMCKLWRIFSGCFLLLMSRKRK